jgi:hypothetical protein
MKPDVKKYMAGIKQALKKGNTPEVRYAAKIRELVPVGSKHPDAIAALAALENAFATSVRWKTWYWLAEATAYAKDFGLWHLAEHGEKFDSGRKAGAISWIAKDLDKQLKRNPRASNLSLWEGLELPKDATRTEAYLSYKAKKAQTKPANKKSMASKQASWMSIIEECPAQYKKLTFKSFESNHCTKARKRLKQK